MALSVDDVLNATQYRSLSRAGRMTESLSSKTRSAFHSKVSRRKVEVEEEAASPAGSPHKKSGLKKGVSPLKLLSVAEVADVDSSVIDARVRAALPDDFVDERVDALCSSGRDHPDVKAKSDLIITLEKEIEFHRAMTPFHGGVQTNASRQSAEAAAETRRAAERKEAERRAAALSGTQASSPGLDATVASLGGGAGGGSPATPKLQQRAKGLPPALSPQSLARSGGSPNATLSPYGKRAVSPLSNPQAANRASPAFAATTDRFAQPGSRHERTPPVGHYRPRYTVVEASSPRSKFPKGKRVLNPANPSPYLGDKMSAEERELLTLAASTSPSRGAHRPHTVDGTSLSHGGGSFASGTFGATVSSGGANAPAGSHAINQSMKSANTAGSGSPAPGSPGQPPGTAPAAGAARGGGSPCFKNRGRDAPSMTRGGTPMPTVGSPDSRGGGSRLAASLRPRSQTPGVSNDSALKARGPSAHLSFDKQLSREQRDAVAATTGGGAASRVTNTATLPLRTGDALHNRGGNAFSFDGYSSREQRNATKDPRPEDQAQRFYDRSAYDDVRFSRPGTVDFGKSPSREQHRAGNPIAPTPSNEAAAVAGSPPPEPPRKHTPAFDMTKSLPRPPLDTRCLELDYTPDDSYTRASPKAVTINAAGSGGGALGGGGSSTPSPARAATPAVAAILESRRAAEERPRYLPTHEELDSPSIRRKLTRDVSIARQVTREQADRARSPPAVGGGAAPVLHDAIDRGLKYLDKAPKGDPRIATHVSRAKRDAVATGDCAVSPTLDTAVVGDSVAMPNLKLGYVSFGKMAERDRHAGNSFANESRKITKLFDQQRARRERDDDAPSRRAGKARR